MHTRELLHAQRWRRGLLSQHYNYGCAYGLELEHVPEMEMELNEIYAILSTREHIPNKQETLSKRQQRGRTKRNQGKKRCQN